MIFLLYTFPSSSSLLKFLFFTLSIFSYLLTSVFSLSSNSVTTSFVFSKFTYYNLRLGLGCNLGRDLSKNERDDQLVKHKDTRLYL